MRNKIFIIFALASLSFGALAQTDFDGLMFFVNPGHGGHDSNDRYMPWAEFYESDANLTKGLYLKQLFEERNAVVFMSRETNTTEDDLALSAISTMANEADVDFFLSIHSNGYNGSNNKPLMLYRGYTSDPVFTESKTMSQFMIKRLLEKGDCWTNDAEWIAGDWDFYNWGTQGLGVLRRLTMPGVLSEGSHHDYVAETWRLKNEDYMLHEAWALLRSFRDFYSEVVAENTGIIAGVIRNPLVSPDYYFKAGTFDEAIPMSEGTVTLMPGGLVYEIDTLNNGYFMFDSVAPGEYELFFDDVENFYRDSVKLTVIADHSVLINQNMQMDTTLVPAIVTFLPVVGNDSIRLDQEFTFEFDLNMDPDSVKKAFVITPETEMIFTWDAQYKAVTVKPRQPLAFKTNYTVSLDTVACSRWGVQILAKIEHQYITVDHTKLEIRDAYPQNYAVGVSEYPQIRVLFNAPVSKANLDANFHFLDADNADVATKLTEISTEGGLGLFTFEPAEPLVNNKVYNMVFDAELTDDYGMTLGEEIKIRFSTRIDPPEQGEVLESYDDIASFWDPNGSGSTVGTDELLTVFTLSAERKINGAGAGKLDYTFIADQGGVCRVHNTAKPALPADTEKMGVWVFGDLSMNMLEYWFYVGGLNNKIVPIDQIDWAGWEFKSIKKTDIGSGTIEFHSTVIVQTPEGTKQSTVYFDEAQVIRPVGLMELPQNQLGLSVYPNPTSENVYVKMMLETPSDVSVSIYTLTGKKVAQIYKAVQIQGSHITLWQPNGNLPKGMYIVNLRATDVNGKHSVKNTKVVIQ